MQKRWHPCSNFANSTACLTKSHYTLSMIHIKLNVQHSVWNIFRLNIKKDCKIYVIYLSSFWQGLQHNFKLHSFCRNENKWCADRYDLSTRRRRKSSNEFELGRRITFDRISHFYNISEHWNSSSKKTSNGVGS